MGEKNFSCDFSDCCRFHEQNGKCKIPSSIEKGVCTPSRKSAEIMIEGLISTTNTTRGEVEQAIKELMAKGSKGLCKHCGAKDVTVYKVNNDVNACHTCCVDYVLPRRLMKSSITVTASPMANVSAIQ